MIGYSPKSRWDASAPWKPEAERDPGRDPRPGDRLKNRLIGNTVTVTEADGRVVAYTDNGGTPNAIHEATMAEWTKRWGRGPEIIAIIAKAGVPA